MKKRQLQHQAMWKRNRKAWRVDNLRRAAPECRQRWRTPRPCQPIDRLGGHRTLDTQPQTPVAQPEALTFSNGPQRSFFPSRKLKGKPETLHSLGIQITRFLHFMAAAPSKQVEKIGFDEESYKIYYLLASPRSSP